MSTAQAPQKRTTTTTQDHDLSRLLEEALEKSTFPDRVKGVRAALNRKAEDLERLLPDCMKGQADRLIQRAVMTLSGTETLAKVSEISFMRCVLKAAELGLAIDGKLAYAVPYGKECTLIVSYVGMLAVARRTKTIHDCYARIVYRGEEFDCGHANGKDFLTHRPNLESPFNGVANAIGAYAIITLPCGAWRYEYLPAAEIERIQKMSKDTRECSIWKVWPTEMWKKTVIRRILKNYAEDPGIQALLALDNDSDLAPQQQTPPPRRQTFSERYASESFADTPSGAVTASDPVDAMAMRIRQADSETLSAISLGLDQFGEDDRDFLMAEVQKRYEQIKPSKK